MTSPTSALVAGILFGLPILGFGVFMPARTVTGTRALEKILGFQEFLDRVESDRFKKMITSPEMFEAFLPFAMALGVGEKWAKAFEDLYTGTFRTGIFMNDLSALTAQAGSVMVSQPRSTGGSGFGGGGGGGGFSGGGFGGGGGGGF
jgi:uncharacterized membrane protein